MRAIICDDDEIILKGLCSVIDWASLGIELVGTAGNGKEGLALLKEQRPELLMTDIRMPHVDGLQLIEEGKKLNPGLMAIVFSGYDDFEYARMALKYGAIDYLLKPINRNEFNQALHRIYENEQKMQIQGVERKKDALEQIKDKIDTYYMEDISLTNLAEAYFMNSDVLSRLFKKKYGVNITSYINDVRLTQAKIYLTAGYNSAQVSEMVGYHDSNYFSRVFKKYYGISPTQFVDEMNHS